MKATRVRCTTFAAGRQNLNVLQTFKVILRLIFQTFQLCDIVRLALVVLYFLIYVLLKSLGSVNFHNFH